MLKRNLIGELRIMKDLNITPNFSSLQREYGTDRHTIKKYYDNGGIPDRKPKDIKSKWDPFIEEIKELISMPHVSFKAAWMFLSNKYGNDKLPGDYNSMRNHLYRLGYRAKQIDKPHPLYETAPGKQAQFDWKEDMVIHLKDETKICFNVFSLTLGYSREHVFIYSSHKTTQDLLHCLVRSFNAIGGACEEYLTDNMSAIVSVKGTRKKIDPCVKAFFDDVGAKLVLSKARTPQTKGKDENANKFIHWIYPYDYKLESEMELISLIENTFTRQANLQINTGTGMPPHTLFEKEKEYLKPLPSKILLDSYLKEHYRKVVPPTQLVYYKGSRYSLGSEYVSKTVDIYPIGDELYIYFQGKLIAKHTISHDRINYDPSHYMEGIRVSSGKSTDEIEAMALENLSRLKALGKEGKEDDDD